MEVVVAAPRQKHLATLCTPLMKIAERLKLCALADNLKLYNDLTVNPRTLSDNHTMYSATFSSSATTLP